MWGILLALLLGATRLPALLTGFVFGAIGPTLVALTLVPALHAQPLPAVPGLDRLWAPLLANGVWGWGTALLLRARLGLRA